MSLFSLGRKIDPSSSPLRALALVFALSSALFFAAPALAQSEFKVTTLSRVSGVSITYLSHQDGNPRFAIRNSSGRGITAYDVLLVPANRAGGMKKGRYVCKGQCSDYPQIGAVGQPAIAAGSAREEWYPADKCERGAVILESAVFDDGTYDGGERSAATLVASLLGSQAEVDRILSAIGTIMGENESPDESRASQVDQTLGSLPTDPDSLQEAAFTRWFPNIRDCSGHFSQAMHKASSDVLGQIQRNLQSLSQSGPPSVGSLDKWWETTKQVLQSYGCAECGEKMAAPTPPVRLHTVSIGCRAPKSGQSSSGVSSAGSSGGSDDGTDSGDLQAEDDAPADDGSDVADAGAGNDPHAGEARAQAEATSQPASSEQQNSAAPGDADSSGQASEQAMLPPQVPTPTRCLPMSPTLMGGIMPANGMSQRAPRPVTDEMFYPRYFRYVEQWNRCLADGQWPEELLQQKMERYPDPLPQETNDDQREAVSVMAADWVETQREEMSAGALSGEPSPVAALRATTWAQAQEAMQRRQTMMERREERAKLVDSRIGSLKLALGAKAFHSLDDYAHELFNAIPGQAVRQQLPENAMLVRYLRLIATMDKYASNGDADGRAAAKARADEQAACGLGEADEQALREVADSLNAQRVPMAGLRARRVESSETAATDGQEEIPSDQPTSVSVLAPGERARSFVPLLDRLQSNLSKPGFTRLEARLHVLYDSEIMNRVVAKDNVVQDPPEQESNSSRTTNEALSPQK